MKARLIGLAIGGIVGFGLVSWLSWTGRDAALVGRVM